MKPLQPLRPRPTRPTHKSAEPRNHNPHNDMRKHQREGSDAELRVLRVEVRARLDVFVVVDRPRAAAERGQAEEERDELVREESGKAGFGLGGGLGDEDGYKEKTD